ncbi:MAG: hypothetical protein A2277_19555 [Desulfobacterales bacterium RIFOXYA12_FULL_46_15]|nr:MAG: hypothetical protein A2277_19555 [Desulfobacterales bacterium RIFOXYA12_FULL_46_15]
MRKIDFITWIHRPGLFFNPAFSSGSTLGLNSSETCISRLFHMKQPGSNNQSGAFSLSEKYSGLTVSGVVL